MAIITQIRTGFPFTTKSSRKHSRSRCRKAAALRSRARDPSSRDLSRRRPARSYSQAGRLRELPGRGLHSRQRGLLVQQRADNAQELSGTGITGGPSPSCWRRAEAGGPHHGRAERGRERALDQIARQLGLSRVLLRAYFGLHLLRRSARVAAPTFDAHVSMCFSHALPTHGPRL